VIAGVWAGFQPLSSWTTNERLEGDPPAPSRQTSFSSLARARSTSPGATASTAAKHHPTGAIVSLWQPRSLNGAALVNEVGAWCWNELATTDVERASAFFGELLGWEYETDERGYASIKNAGSLNGGMREQTERERAIPPQWLPYFTVENVDYAARQAEQVGRRRLLPTTGIHVGRLAVIADPQGAAFAVFEGETDP
jgi:uncharacterized protein